MQGRPNTPSTSTDNISNTSSREETVNSLQTVNRASENKEREKEEIENLLSREDFFSSTDVVGLRLPLAYKLIYRKYIATSRQRLELFKRIVSSAIVALAKQDVSSLAVALSLPGSQIVLNMNVNHIEQRVEQRVDVSIDVSVLEEVVEDLREIIRMLERTSVAYKPALKSYAKRLRAVLARVDDVRKQLTN